MTPKVSIIIRTKNEEKWISHCLKSLLNQDHKNIEIIIVDNNSDDNTLKVAERYPVDKFLSINEFFPGRALNLGIKESAGDFVVCLSAHCIPKNNNWISSLLENFFKENDLAGVYGRQLPLPYTDPIDKRDLLITFGLDRKVQIKDYFFHNANSMIKKDVWLKYPFDENATNIEDRIWGKKVIEAGYKIVYEPAAEVFHHHGLHQSNNAERLGGVVSIINQLETGFGVDIPDSLQPINLITSVIIPVPEETIFDINVIEFNLLSNIVENLKKSNYINQIIILSSDERFALDGTKWIDRKKIINSNKKQLNELLRDTLELIELEGFYPEKIMYVNFDYLHPVSNLYDLLIYDSQFFGYDTIFPAIEDYKHYWHKNKKGEYEQTYGSFKSSVDMEPSYRALYGLGCLTSTFLIRAGILVGGKIGIYPIHKIENTFRIKDLIHNESIKKNYGI